VIVFRYLVAVGLVAFATACSSATTLSAPAPALVAAAPPPSVEDAIRSYSGAFLSGQGEKAAAMLSTRCDTAA
jgi:hypothetical protein